MLIFRILLVLSLLSGCGRSHEALESAEESLFVGGEEGGVVAISPDGVSWERVATGASGDIRDLAFGERLVVGLSHDGEIVTSANGRAWRRTVLEIPDAAGSVEWVTVAYSGERFVAVGTSWDTGTLAYVSDDGLSWRFIEGPRVRPNHLVAVAGSFVLLASHLGDLPDSYSYTLEGDTFTEGSTGPAWGSESITVGETVYVGGYGVQSTTDGLTWANHPAPANWGVAYGNGFFVVAGERNQVHRSPDLENWTEGTTPLDEFAWFPDLAFGAGRFVAAGDEPIYSTDGLSWDRVTGAGKLSSVAYAAFVNEVPVAPLPVERGDECEMDGPLECGDTYCAECVNGFRLTCSTVPDYGNGLPDC